MITDKIHNLSAFWSKHDRSDVATKQQSKWNRTCQVRENLASYLLSQPTGTSFLSFDGFGWNRINLGQQGKRVRTQNSEQKKRKEGDDERRKKETNLNVIIRLGNGGGRRRGWWRWRSGSDGWSIADSEWKQVSKFEGRRGEVRGRFEWWWENGILRFECRDDVEVVKPRGRRESHWWRWWEFRNSLSHTHWHCEQECLCDESQTEQRKLWWKGNTGATCVTGDTYLEIHVVNVKCSFFHFLFSVLVRFRVCLVFGFRLRSLKSTFNLIESTNYFHVSTLEFVFLIEHETRLNWKLNTHLFV